MSDQYTRGWNDCYLACKQELETERRRFWEMTKFLDERKKIKTEMELVKQELLEISREMDRQEVVEEVCQYLEDMQHTAAAHMVRCNFALKKSA